MNNTLGNICGAELSLKAQVDEDIWLLDGDLADSDGAETFISFCPERFINCGIAEQSMVSVGAGLATLGKRPWVFTFAAFLAYRALDQIRVSVCQQDLPVTLVGSHAGGCCGRNGKSHQSISDVAAIANLPNIHIWSPCDEVSVKGAVNQINDTQRPSYLRLPRERVGSLGATEGVVTELRLGGDATVISTGLASHWACDLADALELVGIKVQVIHINRLLPFPSNEVSEMIANDKVFTLEDHCILGGLNTIFQFNCMKYEVVAFGWPQGCQGGSGDCSELRNTFGLDTNTLRDKVVFELS